MPRHAPPPTRGRFTRALVLCLIAAAAYLPVASAKRYYGPYNRKTVVGGGVSVTKTTTVTAGGARGRSVNYGRRLLRAASVDYDGTRTVARRLLQDYDTFVDTAAKVAVDKEKHGGQGGRCEQSLSNPMFCSSSTSSTSFSSSSSSSSSSAPSSALSSSSASPSSSYPLHPLSTSSSSTSPSSRMYARSSP